ncbi:MAG: hypothetical protein HY663_05330 [Chloroflexi bacterium]|nr:hypothetical protein [Chloroflexota bacterium]
MGRSKRGKRLAGVISLLWLALPLCGTAAEGETDLSILYSPPRLSVEARGVSLQRVLSEIGAKVGFSVMDYGLPDEALTISIQKGTVEEVLEQLLRGQNYTVVYGGERISKVVLLSAPTSTEAVADLGNQAQEDREGGEVAGQATSGLTSIPASQSPVYASAGQERELKAEEVLRVHTLSVLGGLLSETVSPPLPSTARSAPSDSGGVFSRSSPADPNDALAITTSLAVQGLTALVDGLRTATNSLFESLNTR